MKKAILVSIAAGLLLLGCTSTGQCPSCRDGDACTTNAVLQAGFNEETYVWEGFIFSTNRVNKAED